MQLIFTASLRSSISLHVDMHILSGASQFNAVSNKRHKIIPTIFFILRAGNMYLFTFRIKKTRFCGVINDGLDGSRCEKKPDDAPI